MKRSSPNNRPHFEAEPEGLEAMQRRYEEAVRRDQEGYERHPVGEDEFAPILGAQTGPE